MQQQGDPNETAKGVLDAGAKVLFAPGVIYALVFTKTGCVGARVFMNPAAAVGFLASVALISVSLPPLMPVIVAALVWMAFVRHRVFADPDMHSRAIGPGWFPLGRDGGDRVLTGLGGAGAGWVLADSGGPYVGFGVWLIAGGLGQIALFLSMRRRRELQDLDARDGLVDARDRAGRLGL